MPPMIVTDYSSAEAYQRLGAIIGQVQSRFIRGAPPAEVFEPLLTDLLGFTGSEYGFVAELMCDPADQHRFLRIRVLTDISWDDATRALFEEHRAGRRPIEFHNLKTLFGAAVTSGKTVISNDPQSDPRSGGRPGQHPPLRSFLGVPLYHGGEMVGVVGLANRPGGYDDAVVGFLDPLFASVGAIIGAVRMEAAREAAEEAVREGRVALIAAAAAQRANAAKTEFLSRMSHELRTPLNAVLGFAQLLRIDTDDPLTPAQHERLRHIETAGGHLLAMIDEVLDLSRIESGSLPMSLDTVSLPHVVDEAVALVASLAAETGVQVLVERAASADGVPARVRADHLRLRQVLVNLISNAVKFNRRGGRVNVRWPASADGATVHIEVSDTGRGMAAQQLAHLFEPFNRLGAEATGVQGTGIGLVISQRLVQSMGGELEVSSEAGVGSSFRVLLPVALHEDPEAIGTLPGPLAPAVDAAAGMRTILYADDNALNIELVVAVLRVRPELRVLVARNGYEAIEAARRDPPDLMLLDMHLGDLTGLEVLQVLATEPQLAHIPCVALSADAMPAAIERATLGGFKAYLTKPLNVRAFLQSIDQVLAAH
jgi:signal transduction histidine kinase/ActR/RegA family two-component response regulator